MTDVSALDRLKPILMKDVPEGGLIMITALEKNHEWNLNVSSWSITSLAFAAGSMPILTALAWQLSVVGLVAVLASTVFGLFSITDLLCNLRLLDQERRLRGDSAEAERILTAAVESWNGQAELVSDDIAALTPETTREERLMLFDRAARLLQARDVIEQHIGLLRLTLLPSSQASARRLSHNTAEV